MIWSRSYILGHTDQDMAGIYASIIGYSDMAIIVTDKNILYSHPNISYGYTTWTNLIATIVTIWDPKKMSWTVSCVAAVEALVRHCRFKKKNEMNNDIWHVLIYIGMPLGILIYIYCESCRLDCKIKAYLKAQCVIFKLIYWHGIQFKEYMLYAFS